MRSSSECGIMIDLVAGVAVAVLVSFLDGVEKLSEESPPVMQERRSWMSLACA